MSAPQLGKAMVDLDVWWGLHSDADTLHEGIPKYTYLVSKNWLSIDVSEGSRYR